MTRIKLTGAIAARLSCCIGDKTCRLHLNKNSDWASRPKRFGAIADKEEFEDRESYSMAIYRKRHTHGNYVWKFGNSMFAGKHELVKQLFEFPPDVTNEEIYLMEDVVDLIASVIDDILEYREGDHEAWKKSNDEWNERMRKKRNEEYKQQYEQELSQRQEATASRGDYLYLMRHRNGLTKIGRSHNPKAREKTLQAEDPFLKMIYKAEKLGWLERRFHDMFADDRVRGEWFRLPEHRVDWIQYYCEKKREAMQEDSCEFN